MNKALYCDKDISINAKEIEIFNYYFPLRTTKKITLKNVKAAKLVPLSLFKGHYRLWGMGPKSSWLNLSYRLDKDFGLVLDTGSVIKSMVTPKDISHVMHILALLDVPVHKG